MPRLGKPGKTPTGDSAIAPQSPHATNGTDSETKKLLGNISQSYADRNEQAHVAELEYVLEAERKAIAMALVFPDAAKSLAEFTSPIDYIDLAHARIVRVMIDLAKADTPIDLVSISAAFAKDGDFAFAKGLATRLSDDVLGLPNPTEALATWIKTIQGHAQKVRESDLMRRLERAAGSENLDDIDILYRQIRELRGEGHGEGEQADQWEATAWPYFEKEGGIWMVRELDDGTTKPPIQMCNWCCHITHETSLDDGSGQLEERYTLKAACQGRVVELELSREEFEADGALARIQARLGARARINPKTQNRYLLDAIKALSGDQVQERRLKGYTGWDGDRYLLANGYIDADGWHDTDRATLPQGLNDLYQLTPGALYPAVQGTFDTLLALAPNSVMIPLVGQVLLAPIIDALDAHPPMVHIRGTTGTHKSAICSVATHLWGDFSPDKFTDSWTSSWKSIQKKGWYLAGQLFLLDDFKRKYKSCSPENVTALLQNYGDGVGRGTLNQNREFNNTQPMRCVLLSNGENRVEAGEGSTTARILDVELGKHQVDEDLLTIVQEGPDDLHTLGVEYVAWIARQKDFHQVSRAAHREKRGTILKLISKVIGADATNPGRVASNVACLYVSWQTFCRFAVERGIWSQEHADIWLTKTCEGVLNELAQDQVRAVGADRYSDLFLELIRSMLSTGRYYLKPLDGPGKGKEPPNGAICLGGRDLLGVYLITGTAVQEASKMLVQAGQKAGFTDDTLSQMLEEDGVLIVSGKERQTRKRALSIDGGTPPRCWHIKPDVL